MHPDPPSALELSYSVFVSSRFSGNIRGRNVGVQRRSVGFAWPKTLPAGHVIRIQTSFIILWERLDDDDHFFFSFFYSKPGSIFRHGIHSLSYAVAWRIFTGAQSAMSMASALHSLTHFLMRLLDILSVAVSNKPCRAGICARHCLGLSRKSESQARPHYG